MSSQSVFNPVTDITWNPEEALKFLERSNTTTNTGDLLNLRYGDSAKNNPVTWKPEIQSDPTKGYLVKQNRDQHEENDMKTLLALISQGIKDPKEQFKQFIKGYQNNKPNLGNNRDTPDLADTRLSPKTNKNQGIQKGSSTQQDSPSPTDLVKRHLFGNEGVGDKVTNTPTGALGVTKWSRDVFTKDNPGIKNPTDRQIAEHYVDYVANNFQKRLPNFDKAPGGVQYALIDAGYNLGPERMSNPRAFATLNKHMEEGNWEGAVKTLLSTAAISQNGRRETVLGLAARRARSYNEAFPDSKITKLSHKPNGEIVYYKEDGKPFYRFGLGAVPHLAPGKPRTKEAILNI